MLIHPTLVRDAMHAPAITITAHGSLPDAVVKMETLNIRRLPVLHEDGQLVGMLTLTDVLRAETAAKLGVTGLRVLPVLEGEQKLNRV